jgi:hypothetical protein
MNNIADLLIKKSRFVDQTILIKKSGVFFSCFDFLIRGFGLLYYSYSFETGHFDQ